MRLLEVDRQLSKVYDPELDEPLTDLGFIGDVSLEGSTVKIQLRLPTFWCAANFAFMMASDIRARVSELDWVEEVEVLVADHFCDDEINSGVNSGSSFSQTFGRFANGELDELRGTFRRKAFYARQERLLRALLGAGWDASRILALSVQDLTNLPVLEPEVAPLAERYAEILAELGLAADPTAPLVITHDGSPVSESEFGTHLREAARTRLSMEFNSSFCRGILQTRYGEKPHLLSITHPDSPERG